MLPGVDPPQPDYAGGAFQETAQRENWIETQRDLEDINTASLLCRGAVLEVLQGHPCGCDPLLQTTAKGHQSVFARGVCLPACIKGSGESKEHKGQRNGWGQASVIPSPS